MATFRLKPNQLARALRSTDAAARRAVDAGIMAAAQRGKKHLIEATRKKKVDYLGQYRNSFQVQKFPSGEVRLLNDSPHAGIVELGARPHPTSKEGIEALTQWVLRKIIEEGPKRPMKQSGPLTPWSDAKHAAAGGVYSIEDEARGIAYAIAAKFKREGQKGKHIFKDELPDLTRFLKEEVQRRITALASRGPRGGGEAGA